MTIGKKNLSLPLYVTKRLDFDKKKYWLIRAGGILLAFLVAGVTCTILKPGSFGMFYAELVKGCFDFGDITTIIQQQTAASARRAKECFMVNLSLLGGCEVKRMDQSNNFTHNINLNADNSLQYLLKSIRYLLKLVLRRFRGDYLTLM